MSTNKFLGLVVLSVAIAGGRVQAEEAKSPAESPAPSTAPAMTITDGQIAKIVQTADTGEIELGEMAAKKAKHKDVKAFARSMVKEHKTNKSKSAALVKKRKMTLEDSETASALERTAKETGEKLKGLKGDEFDVAYVDSQVEMHTEVVNQFKNTLVPNAKNPELKAWLEKTLPSLEKHLAHATDLQGKLKK